MEWTKIDINTLVPGEQVGVSERYTTGYKILTVTKVTKTQVTLSDGSRWIAKQRQWNSEPKELGEHGRYGRVMSTPEWAQQQQAAHERALRIGKLTGIINRANFTRLSEEQLASIVTMLRAADALSAADQPTE
jgi:hypothetical protein